jgi:hypothetical protein
VTGAEQLAYEPPADVTGGAGDQDCLYRVGAGSPTIALVGQLTSGSRGRPRIRSPIWFRLISEVPPAIDITL